MNLLDSLFFFFFFNDTATTEIYTLPYTTLFRPALQAVRGGGPGTLSPAGRPPASSRRAAARRTDAASPPALRPGRPTRAPPRSPPAASSDAARRCSAARGCDRGRARKGRASPPARARREAGWTRP